MSTLPLEVHEVLEEEYRSMYAGSGEAEPERVDYDQCEILEEQDDWARAILTAVGVPAESVRTVDGIKNVLKAYVNDGKGIAKLEDSPALTECGRSILGDYDDYAEEEKDIRRLRRRVVDDAMTGAIKPLRDMRLAKLYAAVHARDDDKARTAFCISGGGIRSATFALGVIQGLASAKI